MKRALHILLALALLCGHVAAQRTRPRVARRAAESAALSPREIVARINPATVTIYAGHGAERIESLSTGAGFFVAPNVVATAYHVVEGAGSVAVTPLNQAKDLHRASVLRFDAVRDLALLSVPTLNGRPLPLFAGSDMYVGERIFTVGNPKGFEGTFSDGLISNFHKYQNDAGVETYTIQFTASVSPGSSGGALVTDRGEVIGVVSSQFSEGQALNFAVSFMHLSMLMQGRTDTPPDTYLDSNMGPPKGRERKPRN